MELFLNLFWFAVSAGGFAAWVRTSRGNRPEARRLELAALAAACLLLFPLISVTDDLQAQAVLAEGSRAQVSAKVYDGDASWKQVRHSCSQAFLVVAASRDCAALVPLHTILVSDSPLVCRALSRWTPLRAPPALRAA